MTSEAILAEMKAYIERELLDGKGSDLEPTTPLLAWGVLTSLSVVRMLAFIRERFGIEIPPDELRVGNLKDLNAITTMLVARTDGGSREGGFRVEPTREGGTT